jgi:hypothetical protein
MSVAFRSEATLQVASVRVENDRGTGNQLLIVNSAVELKVYHIGYWTGHMRLRTPVLTQVCRALEMTGFAQRNCVFISRSLYWYPVVALSIRRAEMLVSFDLPARVSEGIPI